MTITLTGRDLTEAEVVRVARGGEMVALGEGAAMRMRAARDVLEAAHRRGDTIYGLTTGVGAKKTARVPDIGDAAGRERLLVLNHRVGQGPPLVEEVVRAALVRLASHLAAAHAGARPELAHAVIDVLNRGPLPVVRRYGSIGVADLSQNADLAAPVLDRLELAAGEGLALLNHNAVSTGQAALALADAAVLVDVLDAASALDLEAFAANLGCLDPAIADVRPFAGLVTTLVRLRRLLAGSPLWEIEHARNLQDPLSFRCLPQVNGATRDAISVAGSQLAVELNAHQGNPLVVVGDSARVVAVGNFDMLPLAAAVDFTRIALAPALTIAAERTVKLLQRPLSDLPEGLAGEPGLAEDGLAEFGISVQALAAEARLLAQPVSFELASTSQAEGIEDRMTMAPLAARRLAEQVELGQRLVAIELVVAAQAIHLRGRSRLGDGAASVLHSVRQLVPPSEVGDPVPQDLEPVFELVRSGDLGEETRP